MPKVPKPRKHGNRWQINHEDASGKRVWESFATHKEAQAALHRRQAEAEAIRAGIAHAPPPDKTWEELVALWEEAKHRKRSLKDDLGRIRNHLTPRFGGQRLVEITAVRVTRLERDLTRRGLGVETVRHVMGLLRSMLNLAIDHEWLVARPKFKLPAREELDYHWIRSEDDMRRFLRVTSEQEFPGLMEFYATALYTGMRAGELCGLRWSDVDLDQRLITVQRSFTVATKTKAIRRVPILDPLLPLLRAWKLSCGSPELVFPNLEGNMHVKNSRITKQTYHRCLELAEIERIRFHDLRHTFASHWMLKGGDLFVLQKILGHKSIAMTQRYAHLSPEAFKKDWGRFGDFVPREGEVYELPSAGEGSTVEG